MISTPWSLATAVTTATTVIFYLTRNLVVYERLTAEACLIFSSRAEICKGTKLKSCTRPRAVVDETLRTAPSSL